MTDPQDTMVDRVAKAMCAEDRAPWKVWKVEYREATRAAVAAMREPTNEMIAAGSDTVTGHAILAQEALP